MFTTTFSLHEMERLMQQIPHFTPRGHGVMILRKYEYTEKDCDGAYCPHHTGRGKNIGCILERCACLKERIKAGAAAQKEILTGTMSEIQYPPLERRLKQYLKESKRTPMEFRNEKHRRLFAEEVKKLDEKNDAPMAALYLLTADLKLWNAARRYTERNVVHFSKIKLSGIHPDGYTLFCGAKDLYLGTKHLSVSDLSNTDLITPKMFALICNAMAIRCFGLGAIYFNQEIPIRWSTRPKRKSTLRSSPRPLSSPTWTRRALGRTPTSTTPSKAY